MTGYLSDLDAIRDSLMARFPGWQIWYVPHLDRTVTWCARRNPLLNENSPEDLAHAIEVVWGDPGPGSQAAPAQGVIQLPTGKIPPL